MEIHYESKGPKTIKLRNLDRRQWFILANEARSSCARVFCLVDAVDNSQRNCFNARDDVITKLSSLVGVIPVTTSLSVSIPDYIGEDPCNMF